jgi:hypothetical protein
MSRNPPWRSRRAGYAPLGIVAIAAVAAADTAGVLQPPPEVGRHAQSAEDTTAIEGLLATYTRSVSSGDERSFAALLLDENIVFAATDDLPRPDAGSGPPDLRHYSDFHHAVFESGRHFQQQFFNVKIQQDGALAQVSLDFVTMDRDTQRVGYGWKVLQLLKVRGEWKIASELYTAYSHGKTPR